MIFLNLIVHFYRFKMANSDGQIQGSNVFRQNKTWQETQLTVNWKKTPNDLYSNSYDKVNPFII